MGGMLERLAVRDRPVAVPDPVRRPLIGPSTDPAEREADRLADRVLALNTFKPINTAISRGPDGRPLSAAERAFFEPTFGHDFSRVRVYDDSQALKSAHALNARAYTVGEHIVMGDRQAAGAKETLRLLAHELTHVVQGYRAVAAPVVRRVSLGTDGVLSPERQAVVRTAARIAEDLVATPEFARKWEAFWAGPLRLATPRPHLESYQAAVRNRVVHDMDTRAGGGRPEDRGRGAATAARAADRCGNPCRLRRQLLPAVRRRPGHRCRRVVAAARVLPRRRRLHGGHDGVRAGDARF